MTTTLCYPPGADWSCAYSDEELADIEANPATAATMDRANALAWMTLAALTGYQVGVCPITVRPCAAGCGAPGTWMTAPVRGQGSFAGVWPGAYSSLAPYVSPSGQWVNSCGCSKSTDCSCTSLCEAILPGPVGSIVEVRQDGIIVPPWAYRVDNGDRLVRTDGDCWPACQDMGKPGGVTYEPIVVDTGVLTTTTFTRVGNVVTVHVVNDHPEGVFGDNFTGLAPWPANAGVQHTFLPGSVFIITQDGTDGEPSAIKGGGQADGWDEFTLTYITDDVPPTNDPVVIENLTNRLTITREGQLVQIWVEPTEVVQGGNFTGTLPWTPRTGVQVPVRSPGGTQLGMFVINAGVKNVQGSAAPGFAPFRVIYETTDPPAPPDQTGTFSVTYYRGAAPNPMTLWAAGVLAVEFFLACSGKDCRLPAGVTNVSRQGISFEIQTGLFVNGYTGIPEVDAVIGLYNPHGLRSGPVIASPDSRKARIQTWGR